VASVDRAARRAKAQAIETFIKAGMGAHALALLFFVRLRHNEKGNPSMQAQTLSTPHKPRLIDTLNLALLIFILATWSLLFLQLTPPILPLPSDYRITPAPTPVTLHPGLFLQPWEQAFNSDSARQA